MGGHYPFEIQPIREFYNSIMCCILYCIVISSKKCCYLANMLLHKKIRNLSLLFNLTLSVFLFLLSWSKITFYRDFSKSQGQDIFSNMHIPDLFDIFALSAHWDFFLSWNSINILVVKPWNLSYGYIFCYISTVLFRNSAPRFTSNKINVQTNVVLKCWNTTVVKAMPISDHNLIVQILRKTGYLLLNGFNEHEHTIHYMTHI